MDSSEPHRDAWRDSVVRAAAEASRLQPLASFAFAALCLTIVGRYLLDPFSSVFREGTAPDFGDWSSDMIEALPPIALAWALWDTRVYLSRLAKGEVWGPATTKLLGRVGDGLLWASALAMFVVPNVQDWVHGGFGGFDWRFETEYFALAALGLLLSLIARVVGNVVQVAAALKAENDEIV